MSVTTELHHNGQILLMEFTEPWTLDELQFAHTEAYDFLEDAPHELHFISDWTQGEALPLGIMTVRNSSPLFWHPKSGLVAVVTTQQAPRLMVERFAEFGVPGTERFHFFEDRSAAEAFLIDALVAENRNASV
jgi:hypothetical protein